ncbi:glycoside hydrolase family 55 protein [Caballeronia sp. Lep1P3]|uniref:glycoside hydrolase family 55 protein n=1 Tax=Caballeronia sp. Lep1P3 TaxID=2878150 RepID=UPI001FD02A0B|nr:glycoside hydrolase family 55 protein [Caballeronia sp. Lep1P3]
MPSLKSRRRFLLQAGVGLGAFDAIASAWSAAPRASFDAITPFAFGAKGDGRADDTAALNAAYEHARQRRAPAVSLCGATYRVTAGIYARGVSTQGEGATIVATVDAARGGAAFEWGGNGSFVRDLTFDLSNTSKADMQGVLNVVDNARNQRFENNCIVARTIGATPRQSNIFGAWFMGTGLTGLFVTNNQFEACTYGVQINNQAGMTGDVRRAPLGRASSHIHIAGNVCIDASIGVNTPHIGCSNVIVQGNTITAQRLVMDLPLNIAHVTDIAVVGNTVASNASSANGTLHVEDATGAITISGNVVSVLARNNGIQVGTRPSVSGDAREKRKVVISANHIEGSGAAADSAGILIPDAETIDTVIANNAIDRFAEGITVVSRCLVQGNVITACRTPLRVTRDSVQAGNLIA